MDRLQRSITLLDEMDQLSQKDGQIDWAKVFGTKLYAVRSYPKSRKFTLVFKAIVRCFFTQNSASYAGSFDALFFNSFNRADYRSFFELVFKVAPGRNYIDNCNIEVRFQSEVLLDIWRHRYFYFFFKHLFSVSHLDAVWLFLCMLECRKLGRRVFAVRFNMLVVFADMQMLENFLVQTANTRLVKTVTFQHGLYRDTSGEKSKLDINQINYKNCVSQWFLAWGKDTANLLRRYTDVSTFIAGHPQLEQLLANDQENIVGRVIVVFDSELLGRHFNERLLEIVSNLSCIKAKQILVRPHPDNELSAYSKSITPFFDEPSFHDLVIGHNSSLLVQWMVRGATVFKLRSDKQSFDLNESHLFSDADELCSKINGSRRKDNGERYIEYIGNESLVRYTEFFRQELLSVRQ